MATLEHLDRKLDILNNEMKTQTHNLSAIEVNTKTMTTVALADQEARDRIYDRLADGLLKLARVIAFGMMMALVLAIVATFKQEFNANITEGSLNMKTESRYEKTEKQK